MELDDDMDLFIKCAEDLERSINTENDEIVIKVEVPHAFPFPYPPYSIQLDFMRKLYETIELGKIGIFESPTGTGKSLSLICGALTWLKYFEENKKREVDNLIGTNKKFNEEIKNSHIQVKQEVIEPDWIAEFVKKQEQEEIAKKLKDEQELRQKREEKLKQVKNDFKGSSAIKRKRDPLEDKFKELFSDPKDMDLENDPLQSSLTDESNLPPFDPEDTTLLAEYASEDEDENASRVAVDKKRIGDDLGYDDLEEDFYGEEIHVTKIYYCSRTHSQLSQFVKEVQKSPFREETRVTSLGSRQNLCINEAVKRLKLHHLINEKCRELQNSKSAIFNKEVEIGGKKMKSSGCPFYKHNLVMELRDRILVEVRDIEEISMIGKQSKSCPYYATRYALPAAQLVVLPYNCILHKPTREASGIRLEGNIVIIDEGHNLMETISSIHSIEISGAQFCCAHSQLSQYMERYKTRLKAKNMMYIKQILFIIYNCIKLLGGKIDISPEKQLISKQDHKLMTINDFLFATHLDNLNLFKIRKYCDKSEISKKLHGFAGKYLSVKILPIEKKKQETTTKSTWALSNFLQEINQLTAIKDSKNEANKKKIEELESSPLKHIENFLDALTIADKDGRILLTKKDTLSTSSLKFLLLNPAVHFAEVLSKCRSVIIAGGTMQPISDFKDQLLFSTGVKPERILEFSCGHVILNDQLLAISLGRGSSGLELDFTYQVRDSLEMIKELGRVIYNICNIVPGGIVCFFPSYDYESTVQANWQRTGFIQKIEEKKKIYREPKAASQVDKILQDYSLFIKNHSLPNVQNEQDGAILFSVVGGKMSEGINFSDDLGRCIVMVGMPYPNMQSVELKEKMDYLNFNMPKSKDGKLPGQIHYENLCMKAINQSIGRAIRHKNDYAAIMLLDGRFLKPHVHNKLPSWIGQNLQVHERFGPAFSSLRKFFATKKNSMIIKKEPT